MKAPSAKPAPAVAFPIAQVTVGHLIDRIGDEGLITLLDEQMREAFEQYINGWITHQQKLREPGSYKLKPAERAFRDVPDHEHPMYNGRWATERGNESGAISLRLDDARARLDWQEVMVLAGMMCVREMLYGRTVAPASKAAPAAKAKAVRKTAQKKPAAKKPGRTVVLAQRYKPARQRPSPESAKKIATLKDLVAQARPLFEKNPKLDRQGLINKIGRRYERLTTFDELRTLCAGKTVTTHSVKKPSPAPRAAATAWPFPTDSAPKADKPKRPRRDPARPVELPESSIPQGVRMKPWPTPDGKGHYTTDQADHVADFGSGEVGADFAVIKTENGWTYGRALVVKGDVNLLISDPLSDDGGLALDADTAIRNVTADLLHEVKRLLKQAEEGADVADRALVAHVPDLEKLRAWLLGFQARGVEKIAFLKKAQKELELAS